MTVNREDQIVGILLAAGRGTRFGGDKLLARLSRSLTIAFSILHAWSDANALATRRMFGTMRC